MAATDQFACDSQHLFIAQCAPKRIHAMEDDLDISGGIGPTRSDAIHARTVP